MDLPGRVIEKEDVTASKSTSQYFPTYKLAFHKHYSLKCARKWRSDRCVLELDLAKLMFKTNNVKFWKFELVQYIDLKYPWDIPGL